MSLCIDLAGPELTWDRWQTQAQGPFTGIFYEDAEKLENKISAPGGMDWPVIGSSGELAALMNMVSEHRVCSTRNDLANEEG